MQVRAATRPSGELFHPPLDPAVPMLLIGAGSGIAPFRGFIQERALQKYVCSRTRISGATDCRRSAGRDVGKTMLFYGCASPEKDALYDQEMAEWERQGVVTVRYAFSEVPEQSEGCKYAQ
jgi:cytochrome P450/NADPH-cytochrome P450 reductase